MHRKAAHRLPLCAAFHHTCVSNNPSRGADFEKRKKIFNLRWYIRRLCASGVGQLLCIFAHGPVCQHCTANYRIYNFVYTNQWNCVPLGA